VSSLFLADRSRYSEAVHVFDLRLQSIRDHLMLSNRAHTLEVGRLHVHLVHGPATARNVRHGNISRPRKALTQEAYQPCFGSGAVIGGTKRSARQQTPTPRSSTGQKPRGVE